MGYDLEGYDDENHPLQCDIRALLADLCHLDEKQIGHGIDGCGVPNYSVPLKNMALSYLNFSVPEQLNDIKIQEAMRQDRKSTRLNSSHVAISYAVFCLNKKKIP